MIHHGQPRAWRQHPSNVRYNGIGVRIGKWHLGFHDACASALAHMAHGVANRAVDMAENEDFVARLEA